MTGLIINGSTAQCLSDRNTAQEDSLKVEIDDFIFTCSKSWALIVME